MKKTKENLLQALAAVVQQSDDIIVVKDLELRVIATNNTFAKIVGKDDYRELLGKTDAEIFGVSPDQEPIRSYMENEQKAQKLKKGEQITCTEPVIMKDGSTRQYYTRKYPIYDGNTLIGTGNISVDVTEQMRLEQELQDTNENLQIALKELESYQAELVAQNEELKDREADILDSRQRYASLFQYAPTGYIVLNDELEILELNNLAFKILGNLVARKHLHINSILKDYKVFEKFVNWIKGDEFSGTFEVEITTENTVSKWIELSYIKADLFKDDAHLLSIVDITERVTNYQKIKVFAHILDQLPVCIIMTDVKGNITFTNKQVSKETFYTKDELLGKKPSIFKTDHTSNKEYKELWETVSNGGIWTGVFKNKTKHEKNHWMATTISPIHDENEKITHYISIESNIDEKIKMAETLQNQEKVMLVQARHAAMGEMISMIAHQWRQPLSLLSTIASGAQAKYDANIFDIETDLRDLYKITEITDYLSNTIEDFRSFFRHDKEAIYVSINYLISSAKNLLGNRIRDNEIELVINDCSTSEIMTYQNELLQVFINIVNNATDVLIEKCDKDERFIFIDIVQKDEQFIITFNDTGGGIPEEIIDRVFEPYFTTKGPKSGTGLGLYMTKIITEQHLQGSIKVSNNDKGALFTIVLPKILLTDNKN